MKNLLGWFIITQVGAFCYVQVGLLPVALWIGAAGGWVCATYDSGYNNKEDGHEAH